MAEQDIDSIVKGAPAQHVAAAAKGNTAPGEGSTPSRPGLPTLLPGDPLSHAPSSPSMIYLNMLVLEASLRAQFLELRARRRHHTFFLFLLVSWISGFGYALFLAPREDGRGVGGSIYWGVEVVEKVCLMGGIITAVLVWATGIWDRGIRWPRRWLAVANRGLRAFNCKLVLVPRPWWAEMLSTTGFFLTYGIFHHNANSSYRPVDPAMSRAIEGELLLAAAGASTGAPKTQNGDAHAVLTVVVEEDGNGDGTGLHEEDLAPGGDHVKLLLQPKPFSAAFRENWEIYRSEYWDRENERRALLRARIRARDKALAQSQSAWLWWFRLWQPWRPSPSEEALLGVASRNLSAKAALAAEQGGAHLHQTPQQLQHLQVAARERKRRNSSVRRGSVSSTRSQTPSAVFDLDDSPVSRRVSSSGGGGGGGGGGSSGGGGSGSVGPERRRKKTGSVSSSSLGPPKMPRRPGPESRSVTPDVPSPLGREVRDVHEPDARDARQPSSSPVPARPESRSLRSSLASVRAASMGAGDDEGAARGGGRFAADSGSRPGTHTPPSV